jgi:hypothetical protein
VGLKSLKSLNLTNGYPNKNKNKNNNNNNNNKVKSKPLELFELAGKKYSVFAESVSVFVENVSVYARWCWVGLKSLKSLNLTNGYPNNNNNNNIVKSKPLKLFELAGKKVHGVTKFRTFESIYTNIQSGE